MSRRYQHRWRTYPPIQALPAFAGTGGLPATQPDVPSSRPLARADQLRLDLPYQRADAITVTELAREAEHEGKCYDAMVDALNWHPAVWKIWRSDFVGTGKFIPKSGGRPRFIRCGTAGLTDLTGLTRFGRPIFIEVKRPGKRPKPHQQKFLDGARAAGAIVGVVSDTQQAWDVIDAATTPQAIRAWRERQFSQERREPWAAAYSPSQRATATGTTYPRPRR